MRDPDGGCVCLHVRELHADDEGGCIYCTCLHYRPRLRGAEAAVVRIENLLEWAKDNYLPEVDVNDVRRALDGESV